MPGEAARGWNLDPQRAPEPPVTTRRIHSDTPDPGADSGQLPPFRAGSTDAPRTDTTERRQPAADAPLESTPDGELESIADVLPQTAEVPVGSTTDAPVEPAIDDVGLDPVADPFPDPETRSELDPSTVAHEAGRADQAEHVTDAEMAEAWLLDEIVDVEDEEPQDALGEALQEAVVRAAPPFAEDLVRSAEPNDQAVIEEPPEMAPVDSPARQADLGRGNAEVADALDQPSTASPAADGFTRDLATTLESLARNLRARGFSALDEAFARGDRLESSLALFLAGYRAGRGE